MPTVIATSIKLFFGARVTRTSPLPWVLLRLLTSSTFLKETSRTKTSLSTRSSDGSTHMTVGCSFSIMPMISPSSPHFYQDQNTGISFSPLVHKLLGPQRMGPVWKRWSRQKQYYFFC